MKGIEDMSHEEFTNWFFGTVKELYIKHFGQDDWDGLSPHQQHELIMSLAKDLLYAKTRR
ncbi:hypothetical protein SAMN02745671_01145 [Anaerovibrio lipolyticus DSM 3074]|uniref:Uncharacterized protein n=1 Tax=Anaerovibrio lipolyticus DSM 3074 TaxID=1120997 RepID=A0A1M6CKF1_9FIRM|nr:hypothetical protein [Anaerovibrio lipolyticus]SHI61234.1 hypothetical protein SAMN02745671_01145 [Anaerovibrio lipolyticus DSM 3074]